MTLPDDRPGVLIVPERRRPPTGPLRFLRFWKEYLLVAMTLVLALMAVSIARLGAQVASNSAQRTAQIGGLSRQIDELQRRTGTQDTRLREQASQIETLQRTNAVLLSENTRLLALLRARGIDPAAPSSFGYSTGLDTRLVSVSLTG